MDKRRRTQFAVLGFLSGGPKSGYDIKKGIEASTGNFWQESYGQIYPILKHLAAEELAVPVEEESSGGRSRKVYAITEAGLSALRRWISEPTAAEPVRNELLLKTFFGQLAGPKAIRVQMEDYIGLQEAEIRHLEGIRQSLTDLTGEAEYPYWIMTIDYGVRVRGAAIEWAKTSIENLDSLSPNQRSGRRRSSKAGRRAAI